MKNAGSRLTSLVTFLVVFWAWGKVDNVRESPGLAVGVIAIVLAGLVGFLLFKVRQAIAANLDPDVIIAPAAGGRAHPSLEALRQELAELGFREFGPPLEVHLSPPATLVPMIHETAPVYAAIYRTGGLDAAPAKVTYDFVSGLTDRRGGLSSVSRWEAATLPATPGALRQVFQDAAPADLFRRHQEALELLEGAGLTFKPPVAEEFEGDLRASIARQRDAFRKASWRYALTALLNTLRKRTDAVGLIGQQPAAQATIAALVRSAPRRPAARAAAAAPRNTPAPAANPAAAGDTVPVPCPRCGARLAIPRQRLSRTSAQVECPACRERFKLGDALPATT